MLSVDASPCHVTIYNGLDMFVLRASLLVAELRFSCVTLLLPKINEHRLCVCFVILIRSALYG